MRTAVGLLWLLALGGPPRARGSCPPRCSCSLHVLGDGSKARTVVCNDPGMTLPPAPIPPDTTTLRLERTGIRGLPGDALRPLRRLEQLWLPYNALGDLSALALRGLRRLRELRLPGNRLAAFPWAALGDAPRLRLLDLRANLLPAVPPAAARVLRNLTFLDLSGNQLLRLPPELLATWAHLPGSRAKLVLGLQDNPWVCDCRLYDLVHFLEGWAPNLALVEAGLSCASPRSLAGVALSQLELRKCRGPELHPGAASIQTPLGSTALLRCGATGIPGPEMSWRRASGSPLNGTVHQEVSRDGTTWTLLGLSEVSPGDSGDYICQARNFLGAAETLISLMVTQPQTPTELSGNPGARARAGEGAPAAAHTELVARHAAPRAPRHPGRGAEEQLSARLFRMGGPGEPSAGRARARAVGPLTAVGDTDHSVSLEWRAPAAGNASALSVLYAGPGQRRMRRVAVRPGQTRVTLDGLRPGTRYVACVCARGLAPRPEQCVVFSTRAAGAAEAAQRLINGVVVGVAAAVALPLSLLVCCRALRRRCRRCRAGGAGRAAGPCHPPERLGPEDGCEELSPHRLGEADRLLASPASLDSQALGTWGSRRIREYIC
ncbi:leucine-rich repeat, immunoglobulin-like domain and transmembrane domain-containing protein 1 [Dasypus novemcinctus]|uniref:leucine-rich repeat, immunoglobulin-like domain and transmembrane domain-containing protein 1 n=1 Tax=Dasypus novemcinctus TaxID=9361 RepID=UPI00265FA2B7|nr:leucine-rich repeat, immunoglobulin-like domain and transmembrane domain-containing protein 1 [Dasypus novemcinctus]